MGYLGNAPARSFISFERQVFTIVNSQTAYTLSHSVTNENDIRLVVNNVVQEPGSGKAYTASGTTLTLSAALTNGTDEMYCVFLGRAVGTVNAPAGSVTTSQIAADAVNGDKIADDSISDEHLDPTSITGQTAETTIASDDLILLSDTSASGALKKMTRANFVSGIGGTNTPNFKVSNSGNNSIPNNTLTKLSADTETFDSDSAFASDKFTVPSGKGGKYIFTARVYWPVNTGSADYAQVALYKNGSILSTTAHVHSDYNIHNHVSIETVSASDYFEIYFRQAVGNTQNAQLVEFSGFRLIE